MRHGAQRSRRKIDPMAMVWTLTLVFGTGGERSLAGLRRVYQRTTRVSVVPSAFYDRFPPGLVRLLRSIVGELCERVAHNEPSHRSVLGKFADFVVADATVVTQHRMLAKRYAGTRTNSTPAAARLYLVMSVKGLGEDRRAGRAAALSHQLLASCTTHEHH